MVKFWKWQLNAALQKNDNYKKEGEIKGNLKA